MAKGLTPMERGKEGDLTRHPLPASQTRPKVAEPVAIPPAARALVVPHLDGEESRTAKLTEHPSLKKPDAPGQGPSKA